MHHHYADIRDRIDEAPKWWDANGVPRYCEPGTDHTADIYANEVAFVRIACQDCEREFLVSFTWSHSDRVFADVEPLSERIPGIHYGDPPNMECCPAGPTMNSVPLEVVEFWKREPGEDWKRRADLEVDLDAPWEED